MFIVFLSFSSIYCWCIIYTFVCYIKYGRSFWYLTVSFDVYLINLCLCRVKLTDPSLNQIYSSLLLKVVKAVIVSPGPLLPLQSFVQSVRKKYPC